MNKFLSVVQAVTQPFVDQQGVVESLPLLFDLDIAVGDQLDKVGQWIGPTRYLEEAITGVFFSFDTAGLGFDEGSWAPNGGDAVLTALPDGQYRLLLYATVAANHWDGTLPGAERLLNSFWNPLGYTMYVQDNQNMTMSFFLVGPPLNALTAALYNGGYLDVVPAGVSVAAHYFIEGSGGIPLAPIFGFDLEIPIISGFDVGYWDGATANAIFRTALRGVGNASVTIPNKYLSPRLLGVGTLSSDVTVPTPHAGNLLMHFDGTNGSTTMTDVHGNTATANGTAALTTSTFEFGTASLGGLGGTGNYVSVAANSVFDFGTGDFTVECWIKPTALTANYFVPIGYGTPGSTGYYIQVDNTGSIQFGATTALLLSSAAGAVVTGSWQSIQVSRASGTIRIFVNGTIVATLAGNTTNLSAAGATVNIGVGRNLTATYDGGEIDELRITAGYAQNTSNYTPATMPFTS